MTKEKMVLDPVCGMKVTPGQYALVYLEMAFAFCSEQCRKRFLAYPHLYVGYPGAKAPKQEGRSIFRHRRLHLPQPLSSEGSAIVYELLKGLMGVEQASITDTTIEITYDLLQINAAEIEEALMGAGMQLDEGCMEHLKRALAHQVEEFEMDSLEVSPPRPIVNVGTSQH